MSCDGKHTETYSDFLILHKTSPSPYSVTAELPVYKPDNLKERKKADNIKQLSPTLRDNDLKMHFKIKQKFAEIILK